MLEMPSTLPSVQESLDKCYSHYFLLPPCSLGPLCGSPLSAANQGCRGRHMGGRPWRQRRALPPGGATTPTTPSPRPPRVPGVAVPTAAARGRLGPWFSGAEGAQAAGRSEPELNQGCSSGITGIIIGKNNSNGTGSSSHQLLPI